MKHVLTIFTTAFVPTGGLTSVMMNYYRYMDKSNLRIDFASSNIIAPSLLNEISAEGSLYYQLPKRKNVLSYWVALYKLCKRYDVLHVHANSSTSIIELSAAKAAHVKVRIHHNHTSLTMHPVLNRILHPFLKMSYTDAVACSAVAGEWLFGKNNFKILRNAINLDVFKYNDDIRKKIRREFGIDENTFVIGHVGKFNMAKNHEFLINVFVQYYMKHTNTKLLLVGDGDWRKKIEYWVSQSGYEEAIIIAGLRSDISTIVQAMDVFVFPSIYEGMPLSVLEAQASGLPCLVSTNVTNDVNIGIDVKMKPLADDVEDWANDIDTICSSKSRMDRCMKNYQLITHAGYNIKREANELLKLYGV